jgi:hypothetical protein
VVATPTSSESPPGKPKLSLAGAPKVVPKKSEAKKPESSPPAPTKTGGVTDFGGRR